MLRLLSPLARGSHALRRAAPCSRAISAGSMQVERVAAGKPKVPKEELTFGTTFTDHMLEVNWTADGGWGDARILPYQDIKMDPASSALHYALQCFEGMKAYKDVDGKTRLFRPDMNMARLNRSMERLCLPSFDQAGFLDCLKELVRLEESWIPEGEGYSLYIRPTAISTHPFLGVGSSSAVKLYVILSPVGPYYPEGFAPVKLWAERQFVRAWPGGTGDAKVGGNYGPGILPQFLAAQKGFSQNLWLFGNDDEVTEVGTMNMFTFWKNAHSGRQELVTAPLDGTILPGVTRDSVLQLAEGWDDIDVSERKITMPEIVSAIEEERLHECFGSGTAAVVSPIELIHYDGVDYQVPLDKTDPSATAGKLTQRVWDTITGIQYGKIDGPEGWSIVLD